MKTGYTERSGRTLISCAKRDGQCLIAVTLDAPNDWVDHIAMLDYGFATYHNAELIQQGAVVARVPAKGSLISFSEVVAQQTVRYPLTDEEQIREEVYLLQPLDAPIQKGATAGTITYYLGDKVVGISSLVHKHSISRSIHTPTGILQKLFHRLFH